MFSKIRKKITLFNTLILIAFLILFILVLIGVINWSLRVSGENYLKNVAQVLTSEQEDTAVQSSAGFQSELGYQYIEWLNGAVLKQQIEDPNLIPAGHALDAKSGTFSVVKAGETEFRVYTQSFKTGGKDAVIQVWQDLSAEHSVLGYIVTYLVIIGFVGIIVLVPISYLLAGRSLLPVKKSLEDQKKFIANASHELRTPLTVIQTNVEVLKMKEDDLILENLEWLDNIEAECDNMGSLISELLLIAQADSRRMVLDRHEFCMSSVCGEVLALMRANAMEKGVRLTGKIEENVYYSGDEQKIFQMVRIFVDNAIKYTQDGGLVELSLSQRKRNVELSVRDTGIGIDAKDQEKIFERFYRVNDDRNRKTGGTGLGLNIAQMIVKRHGGSITLRSVPGKGSVFSICLPLSEKKV